MGGRWQPQKQPQQDEAVMEPRPTKAPPMARAEARSPAANAHSKQRRGREKRFTLPFQSISHGVPKVVRKVVKGRGEIDLVEIPRDVFCSDTSTHYDVSNVRFLATLLFRSGLLANEKFVVPGTTAFNANHPARELGNFSTTWSLWRRTSWGRGQR